MVARFGHFDRNVSQTSLIEQMARQFPAVSGEVPALLSMAPHHLPHPVLRQENQRNQQKADQKKWHGPFRLCVAGRSMPALGQPALAALVALHISEALAAFAADAEIELLDVFVLAQ